MKERIYREFRGKPVLNVVLSNLINLVVRDKLWLKKKNYFFEVRIDFREIAFA